MQKMEEKRKSAASPVLTVKSGPAVHVKAAARRSLRCCSLEKNATAQTVMQKDKNESDATRKVENKQPKMPLLGKYHKMIGFRCSPSFKYALQSYCLCTLQCYNLLSNYPVLKKLLVLNSYIV